MFDTHADPDRLCTPDRREARSASGPQPERPGRRERLPEPLDLFSEYLAAAGGEARRYLLAREVADIASLAALSARERAIVAGMFRGFSQRELARLLGISQTAALRLLRRAIRKMASARLRYRYAGMAEVYEALTARR